MSTALQFAFVAFSIAFVMFAVLAWRIAPIVFWLMRGQVTYAQSTNDLLRQVEELSERLPDVTSRDITQLKERIARLEKKAATAGAPKRRTKVTA